MAKYFRGLRWGTAALVTFVALVAIAWAQSLPTAARQVEAGLVELQAKTNTISAKERQIDETFSPALAGWVVREIRSVRRVIDEVRAKDSDADGTVPGQAFDAYVGALLRAIDLRRAGREEEAEELDDERVDPAYQALTRELLNAAVREGGEARSAERKANLVIGGAVALLVAALGLLAWSEHRRQRRTESQRLTDLAKQASHDDLTGLPNRRPLFKDLAEANERGRAWFILFDLDGFKSYNDAFGHPQGDLLLRRLGRRLEAAVEGVGRAYRLGGDEFCVLVYDDGPARVSECVAALSDEGDGMSISPSYGLVELSREATNPTEALSIADQRLYAQKSGGRASAHQQTRDLALRILAESNADLRAHAGGVANMALEIGRRVGLDPTDLERLVHTAELHDIGKIAIPGAILDKRGPLSAEEWELVRRHTIIGERFVSAAPALARLGPGVRSSHERWDGHGYPDRLSGEEIPVISRIVFLCDAFEAMTSNRPYSRAMKEADALQELCRCAGTQFDPSLVDVFVDWRLERSAALGEQATSSPASLETVS